MSREKEKKAGRPQKETVVKPKEQPGPDDTPKAVTTENKPGLLSKIGGLVHRRNSLSRDLKKMKKVTEQEKRREQLRKKLFSPAKKKAKKKRVKVALQIFLRKAGLSISPIEFRKRIFVFTIIAALIITLLIISPTIVEIFKGELTKKEMVDLIVFLAAFWTVGFLGLMSVVAVFTAILLDVLIHNRRKQVELVLPDYLQLTAANIGAGMTIDRALWFAVRPRFGVLAKEIEDVAKRVITGEELAIAMRGFSARYDSLVLKRSINLLLEGLDAGGKISELLEKISIDIQEQRILQKEMAANVMTYVIFISFASVLAAPFLFGLATQLIIVIKTIVGRLGTEASGSFFSVTPNAILLSDFKTFCLVTLAGSNFFSAMIVSTIRKGNLIESFRYVPLFILVSYVLYFFSLSLFSGLFGNLI